MKTIIESRGRPASRAGSVAAGGRDANGKATGLADEVCARIREDIVSLRIPPATRVSVDSLARGLGVSQTPVREALSMLEAVGLVTRQHLLGYCTAPKLNRAQFQQLFEMRLLIEPYVARRAATQMDARMLDELCALQRRMDARDAAGSGSSYERFAREDSEFHARIAQGSGNSLMADALSRLHTHLHIFRLRFHEEVTNEAFVEHDGVIRALIAKDADAAEAAMRTHVGKSYERLVSHTQE